MGLLETLFTTRFVFVLLALSAVTTVGLGGAAFLRSKAVSPIGWGWYGEVRNAGGIAIAGWDAVAYHEGTPQLGDPAVSLDWNGAQWRFATDEHRQAFQADPERYAPQFGGFCSFAASKGFTANTDPEVWHVQDGKLYLFDSAPMKQSWLAYGDGPARSGAKWSRR